MKHKDFDFDLSSVESMPKSQRGAKLTESTKKLIDAINANKEKILKLSFNSEDDAKRACYRLRMLKHNKKLINFKDMARQEKVVFVDCRK